VPSFNDRMQAIKQSLKSLPGPQMAMVAGLLVVALISLLVVAMSGARTTMVDLMPGMSVEAQAKARTFLDQMNIAYEPRDGRLMVKPEQRSLILAALTENGQLGSNTDLLFQNLVQSQHWMNTKSQNDQIFNTALQNELSRIISNFRGVKSANVIIDAPETVGMGARFRKPTASVTVFTDGVRTVDRNMVDAIAALVSGAKAGMSVTDVRVIDGSSGRQFSGRSPEDFAAGDYMEHVARVEGYVREKLQNALAYIPGVLVTVSAQVDTTRRQITERKFLPVGQGTLITETSAERNNRTDNGSSNGGEPGFSANAAMTAAPAAAAAGPRSTEEKTTTKSTVDAGTRQETIVDMRGMPTRISVMVGISREYLSSLVQLEKGEPAAGAPATPPTQAEIDARFQKEKARLEAELATLVRATSAEAGATPADAAAAEDRNVVVSMIPVPIFAPGTLPGAQAGLIPGVGGGSAGGASGMAATVSSLVGSGLVRQIVLAGLAAGAIGAMLLMVRKATRPLTLPTAEAIVGLPPTLSADSDVVGEANEGDTPMEGLELEEGQLAAKKKREQVIEMAKSRPQDAAAVLNRWMSPEE
jgi:flagellar biosynthesis/type III secretory pathway M-ring protein FliF/YscJ